MCQCRSWIGAIGLPVLLVLASLRVSTGISQPGDPLSTDYLTVRYYGQHADKFQEASGWPGNPNAACSNFMAVCADIKVNECVPTPPELRAPWNRDVTNWQAPDTPPAAPSEGTAGHGYMLLVVRDFTNEPSTDAKLKLFSGCDSTCSDCWGGTGLALDEFTSNTPGNMCQITSENGLFAIWHNSGTGNTRSNCVDSLTSYYEEAEAAGNNMGIIFGVIGVIVLLVMIGLGVCFYGRVRAERARIKAEIQEALRQGRAEFVVYNPTPGQAKPLAETFSQSEIEKAFPMGESVEQTPCMVCLEPLNKKPTRTLQCGHVFHADCIISWWAYRSGKGIECPACRLPQKVGKGDGATEGEPGPSLIGASTA